MIRQIKLLTKIQMCNFFGINEFKYNKDKKARRKFIGLSIMWVFLMVMLMSYVGGVSYGLCMLNIPELIPSVLVLITSLVVLFFTFFKAGSIIFGQKAFEMQMSLPVTKTAIVVSRFLTMYITNLVLSLLVMIPGMVVYGVMEGPNILFYVYGLIGAIFIPLLPLTIATLLGALITAISSRWKHKSIVASVITIILVVLIIVLNMQMSNYEQSEMMDMLKNVATILSNQIEGIYPMAVWLQDAMINSSMGYLLLFVGVSVAAFIIMTAILQKYFLSICTALNSYSSKDKYKMEELSTSSVMKSLWKKELRMYFSYSNYVINTMIGYLLMPVIAISVLVFGVDTIDEMAGIEGIVKMGLPIILGAMSVITPMTACSISIEGKRLWIIQLLPIKIKDILLSKILANLSVVLPFYIIAEIISFIAIKPTGLYILWLIVLPALYIILGAVSGLVINLKLPKLNWDNEIEVVKQGAATMVMIFVGVIGIGIPVALLLLSSLDNNLSFALTVILLMITIAMLLIKVNKRKEIISK